MKRFFAIIGAIAFFAILSVSAIWVHDRTQEVEAVAVATGAAVEAVPERPVLQQHTIPVPQPASAWTDTLAAETMGVEQLAVSEPETAEQTILVDSSSTRTRLLVRHREVRALFPEVRAKLFGFDARGLSVETIGEGGARVATARVPSPALELGPDFTIGVAAGNGFAGPSLAVDAGSIYGVHLGGFAAASAVPSWGRLAAGPSAGVELLDRLRLHVGADLLAPAQPRPVFSLGHRF